MKKSLNITILLTLLLSFFTFFRVQAGGPMIDLGLGQQAVTIRGNQANAHLSEVASADFNGDGYADLLMGAPGNSKNGVLAGAAYVIFGSAAPTANPSIDAASLTLLGGNSYERLGQSVATGDVNHDGFPDIIVGGSGYKLDRGAVYVILGGKNVFASPITMDLALPGPRPALTVKGPLGDGRLGRSVAGGDINGDGYADIVIGSYTADPAGRTEAGAIYVLYGNNGISANSPSVIDLSSSSANLTVLGAAGGQPSDIGDRLGRSVATGDVNGDGLADIIAGAPGANVTDGSQTSIDAGKSFVFYGSLSYSGATHVTLDLNANPDAANVSLDGINASDNNGFTVASGDFNHDGLTDILTAAYSSQGSGNNADQAGEFYIIYGKNSLPGKILLASGAALTVYGGASGDHLGRSLALGDINQDGFQDIIAGAYQASPNGRINAGEAYVIYGGASLPASLVLSNPASANVSILGEASSGLSCIPDNTTGDCNDEAGTAVGSGDFNGDGVADLLVGAPFANQGSLLDNGAVYVVYGSKASSVQLIPATATIPAGKSLSYSLMASNVFGSWDASSVSDFAIQAGAGGSWLGNIYTAGMNPGIWTVTAKYLDLSTSASLVIDHGPVVGINVIPGVQKAWVGDPVTCLAIAQDSLGNHWDVSKATTFSITPAAHGNWAGNVYTPGSPGQWTITGIYQGLTGTAPLVVSVHDPAVSITIDPLNKKIWFLETIEFRAMAHDAKGISWDVTKATNFYGDGGTFNKNIFTGTRLGTYGVKVYYNGLTAVTKVTIAEHGAPVSLQIKPQQTLMQPNEQVHFTTWAVDQSGNTWEVTKDTNFSIDQAAGGTWNTGNIFTSQATGTWEVKGVYQVLAAKGQVIVLHYVNRQYLPTTLK